MRTGGPAAETAVDVIILAGGLGTRLREVVPDLPKPLSPVGGRPFLDILLGALDTCRGIDRVVLAVGHMADRVVARYREAKGYRFRILFSVEREPLGTGGAVRLALEQTETADVLVLNGDSFVDVDLPDLVRAHRDRSADATIVLVRSDETGRYGRVTLAGDGRIARFEEKGPGSAPGHINAGMYLFRRSVFDDVPRDRRLSLERDILPAMLAGNVRGFVSGGRFIDIGTPESYRIAQDYFGGKAG